MIISAVEEKMQLRPCRGGCELKDRSAFILIVKDSSVTIYLHERLSWLQTRLRRVIPAGRAVQNTQFLKHANIPRCCIPVFSSYSWTHSSFFVGVIISDLPVIFLQTGSFLSPLYIQLSWTHFCLSLHSLKLHSHLSFDFVCFCNVSNFCRAFILNKPSQCIFRQPERWCVRYMLK